MCLKSLKKSFTPKPRLPGSTKPPRPADGYPGDGVTFTNPGPPWFGTSVYQAIVYPLDDIKWFINEVAKARGNCAEFFLAFSWPAQKPTAGWKQCPFLQVGTYKDPEGGYGDYEFPKYDLSKFNDEVWAKWSEVFGYCKSRNVVPFVRVRDYCSVKNGFGKRHYFARANIQRLDLHLLTEEPHVKIRPYLSALHAKLVDTLRGAGCDTFFIVPENEADYTRDEGDTDEKVKNIVVTDQTWATADLMGHGVPKENIVISTSWGFDELALLGTVMETHGVNSDRRIVEMLPDYDHRLWFPNGDGYDLNALGRAGDKPIAREPSVDQGRVMGRLVAENNVFGYAYFNRDVEAVDLPDIRRAQFDVLAAITGR